MSREAARQEITAAIAAAVAAFGGGYTPEVDYENRDAINYAGLVNPYVAVDILYFDGEQMELGQNPIKRVTGVIMFAVGVPEGKGTKTGTVLIDHLEKSLQYKIMPLVKTEVSKPQEPVRRKGFYYLMAAVPFWYDEPVV